MVRTKRTDKILEYREKNLTCSEIAMLTECSHDEVLNVLNNLAIRPYFNLFPLTGRTNFILYYHDKGLNNAEIARLVECSRENVRQTLERSGKYSVVCWSKNKEYA